MGVETTPSLQEIIAIAAITAAAAYGAVEIIKAALAPLRARYPKKADRWWYNLSLRLSSVVCGAAVGYTLYPGWGWAIGIGAGGLNSVIVAALKAKIKRRSDAPGGN